MRAHTEASYQYRVGRVLAHLEANVSAELNVSELAEVAHFSQYHFHRVFKGVTGESIHQCVRRLRLESAARKLRRSEVSVLEIALLVGFQSHEGFTRAFRKQFLMSPSQYRVAPDPREELARSFPPLVAADVEVREVEEFQMACWAHRGSFAEVPQAWAAALGTLGAAGLVDDSKQLIGRYPDDPDVTPTGSVRYEVGIVATGKEKFPLPFFQRTIPKRKWAVTVHKGCYSTLSETYLRLVGGWFVQNGVPLADGACLELYKNLPNEVEAAELLTEVWAPIGG